jgi:pyruvate dehydrogenase E2 component (dihydrolipoamide acetyltransferase)
MYEIVMPQLSDSMDEGKLISWKVSVGQKVNVGDVIAEVESDKAIMEVQSFKAGTLQEVSVKEGDVVAVGTVMAKINIGTKEVPGEKKSEIKSEIKPAQQVEKPKKVQEKIEEKKQEVKVQHKSKELLSGISPKARAKAASYGVEISEVVHKNAKQSLHADDVDAYIKEHYFTPKAQKLMQAYQLDTVLFTLDHKVDSDEVQQHINANEIPLPLPLTSMQKAIISNVTASANKPIFHIYETIDATLFEEHKEHSITVWLVKIFSKVMIQHEAFRSRLLDNAISVFANASVSLAVANDKNLYMPVVKDANKLDAKQIAEVLSSFKTKLQASSFSANDMQGSSFGISNLGMLGVERFDAMINKEDTAIAAIGAIKEGKISVTLTADHRVINGYEAALFMADVKKEAQNSMNFKAL